MFLYSMKVYISMIAFIYYVLYTSYHVHMWPYVLITIAWKGLGSLINYMHECSQAARQLLCIWSDTLLRIVICFSLSCVFLSVCDLITFHANCQGNSHVMQTWGCGLGKQSLVYLFTVKMLLYDSLIGPYSVSVTRLSCCSSSSTSQN